MPRLGAGRNRTGDNGSSWSFCVHDSPQQPAQDVRSGDYMLFFPPVQDDILVDHVIIRTLRLDLQARNNFSQAGQPVPDNDRPVAVGIRVE